jgi:hypothetical protein
VTIAATVTRRLGRHLAAASRRSVGRRACAVSLLGHTGSAAIAVAGIGLPVAAAHRLVDCDAPHPDIDHAGSSRIGHVAGPRQQIAELPGRAGHPGDAAAGLACAPARAASPRGAAGSRVPAGSRGAAGSRRASGSRGSSSSRGAAGARGATDRAPTARWRAWGHADPCHWTETLTAAKRPARGTSGASRRAPSRSRPAARLYPTTPGRSAA